MDARRVENEPDWRPYFVDNKGARLAGCLSISHREGKSLCALAAGEGARIGADIEKIEPKGQIFVEDYLSANEQKEFESCVVERRDLFVTLSWSAKEAVFKALGSGLRIDTRKVEIFGVEESARGAALPLEWTRLGLRGPALPEGALGWWKTRGDFILTLAALDAKSAELIDLPH